MTLPSWIWAVILYIGEHTQILHIPTYTYYTLDYTIDLIWIKLCYRYHCVQADKEVSWQSGGYDVELFVDTPDYDLMCTICQGVLRCPVRTACHHVFCKKCILQWLKRYWLCLTTNITQINTIRQEYVKTALSCIIVDLHSKVYLMIIIELMVMSSLDRRPAPAAESPSTTTWSLSYSSWANLLAAWRSR